MSYSYNANSGALSISVSAGGASENASFSVKSSADLKPVRDKRSALMGKYRDNPEMQTAVSAAYTDAINGVEAQLKGKKVPAGDEDKSAKAADAQRKKDEAETARKEAAEKARGSQKKQSSTETQPRVQPKPAPKKEEARPSATVPLPAPEAKTATPRKAESETKPAKKGPIGIPPSPPVSNDWLTAQLHRAAKGERRAVDSLYQRSLYVQDYLATPTDSLTHSMTVSGDMELSQNLKDAAVLAFDTLYSQSGFQSLASRFDRFYQKPESKAQLSILALNDPKIGELEELMSDPSNKNHSISKVDLSKRPDLLVAAVRLLNQTQAGPNTSPSFMEFLMTRAQDKDNPDSAKLLAVLTDPANTKHSIESIDRISQGRLLGEAVDSMRAFFYDASSRNKNFESEMDKIGYNETLFMRILPGSDLPYPTVRHSSIIDPMLASPQLLTATGLYMSRFDEEGRQRQGVAPWRPPAVVPRPEPEEPMKAAVPPAPLVPTPVAPPVSAPAESAPRAGTARASQLPQLSEEAVKRAIADPKVLWEGTSLSMPEAHKVALEAQLKTRKGTAYVDGRGQGSGGVMDVRQNMDSDLGGDYNTVVFEAGVNDLQGVVSRAARGDLKTTDQLNKAADAVFAQTVAAARSALSKGKVLILATVPPWGGYQRTPELQAIADIVTERFNSQVMSLYDPAHGIFVVDMQAALGSKEMPKDLRSKPPAGWPANHNYSPPKTTLWLSQEFRGLNAENDPRTGYLHFNDAGHTAMGKAVWDQVYAPISVASTLPLPGQGAMPGTPLEEFAKKNWSNLPTELFTHAKDGNPAGVLLLMRNLPQGQSSLESALHTLNRDGDIQKAFERIFNDYLHGNSAFVTFCTGRQNYTSIARPSIRLSDSSTPSDRRLIASAVQDFINYSINELAKRAGSDFEAYRMFQQDMKFLLNNLLNIQRSDLPSDGKGDMKLIASIAAYSWRMRNPHGDPAQWARVLGVEMPKKEQPVDERDRKRDDRPMRFQH